MTDAISFGQFISIGRHCYSCWIALAYWRTDVEIGSATGRKSDDFDHWMRRRFDHHLLRMQMDLRQVRQAFLTH